MEVARLGPHADITAAYSCRGALAVPVTASSSRALKGRSHTTTRVLLACRSLLLMFTNLLSDINTPEISLRGKSAFTRLMSSIRGFAPHSLDEGPGGKFVVHLLVLGHDV